MLLVGNWAPIFLNFRNGACSPDRDHGAFEVSGGGPASNVIGLNCITGYAIYKHARSCTK